MSGLSETERAGCTKLLQSLSKDDVFSLSDTVTNKLIVVENVTEAIGAIITFTENAEEFLKRKKVHRDLIFKYLANEGVVMPPNSEKNKLVKRTLELWSSGKVGTGSGLELVLGQQFCQWFFPLLNSQNPSLGQPPQDWGPKHFWPDAKLCLLSRAGSEQMEEFLGAELVSLRLLALTRDEQVLLSPNLEPQGLRTLASPHGLVLVAVAGTIHRDGACLGVFEQIFGLIRSPLENNSWKIKFVNLKIRGQDSLAGAETAAPTLTYNSTELQLLFS
ncbi:uncharacterized protein C3orf38 homolog [Trematomus bernacchii]|uniref:uncharacterized protein C3orf38 homolog n=1 Tax=Trematomus bernacchii TaxID=40690 RepID=UPI00146E418F|nr:uncharacterized protein C3orf38 homolog [Trematomus bernacchii]